MTHDRRKRLPIDALYQERWEPIVAWLTKFMKNRADAEEVTAEAFAKLASIPEEPHNPEGLLWVIARGFAIDRLRHRDLGIETLCDPDTLLWYEESALGRGRFDGIADIREAEARADLTVALRELDETYRQAWALTELRGLTTYEAAEVLGVSQPTASRRAERARVSLEGDLA
jgi:RNA polymerase sigma factor (sigma-70 family)